MKLNPKIILAILLFSCLLDMPYGYYQLVRAISMVAFGYFGYEEYEQGNKQKAYIYWGLALLFQPIIKISLGRVMWNLVDVVVGVGLFLESRK